MNDPRAKAWGVIEQIIKDHPEHADVLNESKDALKAWGENEVRMKTEAITSRGISETALSTLQGEHDTLKNAAPVVADPSAPSAALDEALKRIDSLEGINTELTEKGKKDTHEKFMGEVKGDFLKAVNLKDDFAESKIDLAIAKNQVKRAEDGTTQISIGSTNYTVESYGKHLEETHGSQLKVVTGGKQGNLSNEPAGDPDKAAALRAEVAAGTKGNIQIQGFE